MDVLEIRYENGHMTINVPVYFPCLQKNARKLFPLIKRYCTGDDRAALGRYLYLLRAFLQAQMETGDGFSGVPPDWEYGSRFVTYSVTERRSLYKRADSNYRHYCKLEVDDEWMN